MPAEVTQAAIQTANGNRVSHFPETSESLLVDIKDASNRVAWEQFARIYRPIIHRIAVGKGFQDADAHDLAQQVLLAVSGAIGSWEKSNSSVKFRHWLSKVIRNAILNAVTRRPQDLPAGGSAAELLKAVPRNESAAEELLTREYRRELFLRAAAKVHGMVSEKTWSAFELTVLDGETVESVASQLGISAGSIYTARSRVMMRLREEVRNLEAMES